MTDREKAVERSPNLQIEAFLNTDASISHDGSLYYTVADFRHTVERLRGDEGDVLVQQIVQAERDRIAG